jgi:hypothetical protein
MPNDIFVDNTAAKNFCNPVDQHYKEFIKWLFEEGYLVVTNKILGEYVSSTGASPSETNIVVIIARLTRDGRLVRFTKQQLEEFSFSKRIEKKLRSNSKDHPHIKAVLLSTRKLAVSLDDNFRHDVNNYPGYGAVARKRPEELAYK